VVVPARLRPRPRPTTHGFPPLRSRACLLGLVALLASCLLAGNAVAASPAGSQETAGTGPGSLAPEPFGSGAGPRLTEREVVQTFLKVPKVADWLARYPPHPSTDATFDRDPRTWTVYVWSGRAGEIATGTLTDHGGVTEAWTGPQVAWKMARGRPGAFGGKLITSWPVWLGLSLAFLLGLVDLRRPLSVATADLLVLLSFGVSLAFFNRGEVFESAALAVPPLVYLLLRTGWIGFRRQARPRPAVSRWPVWVLAAATLFLVGFRVGLDVQGKRTVIDVGYAGVIGADRIVHGQAPYGHMPVEVGKACGPKASDGEIRDRIQTNGRCESANPSGDTYGPVAYLAYVPAVLTFGWSGRWDGLPAAHATAIAFDLAALLGLVLVGLRFGGPRLGAVLAFGWAAYPFTTYALLSNTNDAIMPALLVWGFWLASSPVARGAAIALAGWTKFAALALAPLWLTYRSERSPARTARFAAGFVVATLAAFSILLLEPSLLDAGRTFWDRTLGFQIDRDSPFSIWGWGQYHARGIPDLASLQTVVQAGTIVLAGAVAAVPREKGPLELAALSAAVLLAVELSLTHWFYLYLPWVLPFVLLAVFLPRARPAPVPVPEASLAPPAPRPEPAGWAPGATR
jgi:hypothetical protein